MAKEKKKGRVFAQTTKGTYPFSILKRAEKEQSSKQLEEESKWFGENDLMPTPFPPGALLTLYESNPVLNACVKQLAVDASGLGWNLHLREDKAESKDEFKRLDDFLRHPHPEDSLEVLFKELLVDYGAVGWFGIEVVKDNMGVVSKIYRVPAHTLRIHKSKDKFCQVRDDKKVWFKKFGLDKEISPETGKEGSFTGVDRANELIYYKNFDPKSDYYGVPNSISAVGDVMGLISLRDYNLAFFENYGVPSAIITLGGEWEGGSDKKIADYMDKEFRGTASSHRTLVVASGGTAEGEGKCTFDYQALGVEVKEGSFRLYERDRKDNILMSYSMPPERVGVRIVGPLGGNDLAEATKIYVQSVVEPLQTNLESIINIKLLQSEIYDFKFVNIDLRNYAEEIKQMESQIEHGMMTPNQAINKLGGEEYPEGNKYYMMSSLLEIGGPKEEQSKVEKEFLDECEKS